MKNGNGNGNGTMKHGVSLYQVKPTLEECKLFLEQTDRKKEQLNAAIIRLDQEADAWRSLITLYETEASEATTVLPEEKEDDPIDLNTAPLKDLLVYYLKEHGATKITDFVKWSQKEINRKVSVTNVFNLRRIDGRFTATQPGYIALSSH